uniref:Phosphoinositide phospholipase C n=1 Tax=Ditylenchus dipsaci TaxID=166011 RepID=A0A915ECC4_9BILA
MSTKRGQNRKSSPLRSSLRKPTTNIRQKSPGRKTVSFCSDKKVSNVNDCFQIMQNGTELIKLRTNVRQFRRVFSLDADLAYIRWTPTNKKPHKARISVDSIKEVRIGTARRLRLFHNLWDEYEVLDLIALTADDANVWVVGLMALSNGSTVDGKPSSGSANGGGHSMANLRERWLTNVFNEADTEHKGYISEKSAVRLIRSINTRLLTNRIKQKIKEAGAANPNEALRGRIDCNAFVEVASHIAYPIFSALFAGVQRCGHTPEVYFLMVRYANKDYLSCSDLQIFLEAEQGIVGVTKEFCENIIDQCEPSPEAKENNYMTIDGFTNYLLSDSNSIFESAHQKVHQDMDQPMSRYFIATSYNTYLVEDQLKGPSSVDGYISTLKRNCRFIELDLWEPDEEDGDEPVIHHGGTLTTKLKLSSVLSVINELAFERSRYPLFVRLEIHLSIEWQMKLCELLKKHLGTKLYNPSDDPVDWTLPENSARYETKRKNGGEPSLEALSGEVTEEDEGCDILTGKPKKEKRLELCRELCDLLAPFAQSKHLKELTGSGLDTNLSPKKHIVSMSESNCLKIIHNQASTFGQLYRNFMLRVTPNVARVDSSNLNPQEFWNSGINFVAMNYQTLD